MTAPSAIEALSFWKGRPVLKPIDGGRTNRNYMADDGNARYFVRSGRDIPLLGISRKAERRCAELAATAGLAPRIRHAEDGVLITDFVSGTVLDSTTACRVEMLRLIARHLSALHGIPASAELPLFCPVTISLGYLERLDDASLPFERERLCQCLADLPRTTARCLVHGDLIPENFILGAEGKLYLIDWEYAGNGTPAADIALIASNFDLSREQIRDFVSAYGEVDHAEIARFQIAAAIREALWCLMQLRFGEASADLPAYARKCAERVVRMLA